MSSKARTFQITLLTLATVMAFLVFGSTAALAAKFHPSPIPTAIFGPTGGVFCPGGTLAAGSADIAIASGKGDKTVLAEGKGDLTKASDVITNVATTTGTFSVGESISGFGIPLGATITAVDGNTLTLSAPAKFTVTTNDLISGSKVLSNITATKGSFSVGMAISGSGIPSGTTTPFATTITAVGANTLTLSDGITAGGSSIEIRAGSISNAISSCGAFKVGQRIEGLGIPDNTVIAAINGGVLVPSSAPTVSGTGIELKAFSASSFGSRVALVFHQGTKRLFALDQGGSSAPSAIYGFDVSAPNSYLPLTSFSPLTIEPTDSNNSGIAVDNTAGASAANLYYSNGPNNNQKLFGFSSAASILPGWPVVPPAGSVSGADVDSAGNVWVASTGAILAYNSAGQLVNTIDTSNQGPLGSSQLAIDSNGDIYVDFAAGIDQTWKYPAPDYDHPVRFLDDSVRALAVDRTTHDVYRAPEHGSGVERYTSDGLLLETFAASLKGEGGSSITGVAIDEASGDAYVSTHSKIYVFGAQELPVPTSGAASAPTDTSTTLNGTVRPDGIALTDCHFEYVTDVAFEASGFTDLSSGGSAPCAQALGSIPVDSSGHPVSAAITGLSAATSYRFQLVAANANGTRESLRSSRFVLGRPAVESTGSPLRTATTARLDSRLYPRGVLTDFHFEYGTVGPCSSSPCTTTASEFGGGADLVRLVSQEVTGLQPGITYHYRLVAGNGHPEGPTFGEDMTLTTRDANDPLEHGSFPGPPGSDRAWEQVNTADTNGNPVQGAVAISDEGDRVVYRLFGGTSEGSTGSLFSQYFAERPVGVHPRSGWQTRDINPDRNAQAGANWDSPAASDDLSTLISRNFGSGEFAAIRTGSEIPAATVFSFKQNPALQWSFLLIASDDGSRVVMRLRGSFDPAYPAAATADHIYDVTTGTPQLLSLLPGDTVPTCGVSALLETGNNEFPSRSSRWVSRDGTLAFFPSRGSNCSAPAQVYVRDLNAAVTTRVSPPPLSGPDCGAVFIKSTLGADAVFFWTQSRLVSVDSVSSGCNRTGPDGDVYRYDIGDGSVDCVTCVLVSGDVDVAPDTNGFGGDTAIAIAENGSRLYFTTRSHLLPGAQPKGERGIYRVDLLGKGLAYVAPLANGGVGEVSQYDQAMTPNGAVIVFRSSDSTLDTLTSSDNGGTQQYYRYDDRDRTLICVSCPQDGGTPFAGVSGSTTGSGMTAIPSPGPNITPLADDGTFAFNSPTPLVSADQNTVGSGQDPKAGTDVYEWRDGRVLLVTDGLTNWPGGGVAPVQVPVVSGVSPSGRDIFFTAAAQYTQDALDAGIRLYTARIGGGIDFPAPQPPCPLEVCQGTPKGAPEDPPPGTSAFSGPGNVVDSSPARKCRRGQRKVRRAGKIRCVNRRHNGSRRANHNRRAAR